MTKKDRYRILNTKVKPEVWDQLMRLCQSKGMTVYQMMQMMCDSLVRYMDDKHNLSPELEEVMSIFEHMIGWQDAFNLADPFTKGEVAEAVYISQDPTGKKRRFRANLIRKPWMGKWEQTNNVTLIYERMTEVLLPEIYRNLRHMAVEMGCTSIVDLLRLMIDAQAVEDLNEGFRREFEDARRADNGKPVEYGKRTKRKKHYEPDTMPLFPDFEPIGGKL